MWSGTRPSGRVEAALERLAAAAAGGRALGAGAAPADLAAARGRLAGALVELREAADVAAGEWWQGAPHAERVAAAEREAHRLLAALGPAAFTGSAASPAPAAGRA
ncbi:hypothetical protein [Actinomadura sp. 21ATH]|uniref:hypothetical protein n=1 Tax=Actinomadura sp. 21ATH TaxID=1735444 RepID=UPI0035C26238